MTSHPGADPSPPGRPAVMVTLASATVVGAIAFPLVAFVHSMLRDDHSLLALPISALAAGPTGWIQNLNFVVLAIAMLATAVGLHLAVLRTGRGILGPAFLALSGIGLIWAALFPAIDAAGAFTDTRAAHAVGAMLAFAGAGVGLTLAGRRMSSDPGWQDLATYTRTVGLAILALFVVGSGVVRPPSAPLHPWLGLYQWLLLAVWLPCIIMLGRRLLREGR